MESDGTSAPTGLDLAFGPTQRGTKVEGRAWSINFSNHKPRALLMLVEGWGVLVSLTQPLSPNLDENLVKIVQLVMSMNTCVCIWCVQEAAERNYLLLKMKRYEGSLAVALQARNGIGIQAHDVLQAIYGLHPIWKRWSQCSELIHLAFRL